MHLFLFLLFLYWRLPINSQFIEKLSERFFLDNGELNFLRLRNDSGQNAPKEITDTIKYSLAFKQSARQIIPFAPFYKDKDWAAKVDGWRFFYTGDNNSWYMVGDNPIIVKKDVAPDFVTPLREFAFPVSGNILLIGLDEPVKQVLPSEFVIQFNTSIIETSQRFVACQNKNFLTAIICDYKIHVEYKKTGTIIQEMFDMLKDKNMSG